jgi:hypothetical protein
MWVISGIRERDGCGLQDIGKAPGPDGDEVWSSQEASIANRHHTISRGDSLALGRILGGDAEIMGAISSSGTFSGLHFGGELPMRSLIRSNPHPQIYRLIYSKVAELLFILRSH